MKNYEELWAKSVEFHGHEYSKKTDYASHLLADSDLSIEELAKKVGFDTVSGFSTSFKKQMGIPPSEYRRQIEFNCLKNPSEVENLVFESGDT